MAKPGRFVARRRIVCLVATGALSVAGPVMAGPPYVTDDPEPTNTGGWENYFYVTGTNTSGDTVGDVGIELNYGAATDLQLSVSLPLDYDHRDGYRFGGGDVDLGAKYRFAHQSADSWLPDVAVFPSVNLPTAARTFGPQHASFFLPLWLEKDIGPWSTFGGGGYTINPGQGNRNYQLFGWAVTRTVTSRLTIGAEVYHQTASVLNGKPLTNIALGFTYQMSKHYALMASGGPGVESPAQSGQAAFYASIQYTN
jgi:hypothetical protein